MAAQILSAPPVRQYKINIWVFSSKVGEGAGHRHVTCVLAAVARSGSAGRKTWRASKSLGGVTKDDMECERRCARVAWRNV
jgi:hypothetical protein